jgi:methylenetetrahydrofolate dehydrogenase (NADP+)/methenyltetrahydrofolate cyclohydrolase
MTRLLNGSELASYVKERQARQVRALRQAEHIFPKLVIIKSPDASSVIETYVRMKRAYGDDILIETELETLNEADMPAAITRLNNDESVHGIIVQLPLSTPQKTDEIVGLIAPAKDVDGLASSEVFDSATAVAINWLLVGYNVDLKAKKIVLVGNGRLVGAPLTKMWRKSGFDVTVLDDTAVDLRAELRDAQIIVSATGVPHLLTSDMIPIGAVVVDAGTASEDGVIRGDVSPEVRERDDVTITPEKGGVGPLTISAIFDHLIVAASKTTKV